MKNRTIFFNREQMKKGRSLGCKKNISPWIKNIFFKIKYWFSDSESEMVFILKSFDTILFI